MATALTSFFPYVRMDVMQAAEPLVLDAVRNSAIEFCELTWIHTLPLAAISSVAGQSTYDITVPAGFVLVAIKSLSYGGIRVSPTSEDELDSLHPTMDWRGIAGRPYSFYQTADTNVVSLFPIPDTAVANGVRIVGVMKPSLDATTVPDFLYQDWRDDIASGAKNRLFMITGASWGDPNKAVVFGQKFTQGVNRAKMLVAKGFGKRPLAVRPGRWWGRMTNG